MKRAILALVLAAGAGGAAPLAQQEVAPDHFDGHDYQLQARGRSLGPGHLRRSRNIKRAQKMAVHSRTRETGRKGSPRRSRDLAARGAAAAR